MEDDSNFNLRVRERWKNSLTYRNALPIFENRQKGRVYGKRFFKANPSHTPFAFIFVDAENPEMVEYFIFQGPS